MTQIIINAYTFCMATAALYRILDSGDIFWERLSEKGQLFMLFIIVFLFLASGYEILKLFF